MGDIKHDGRSRRILKVVNGNDDGGVFTSESNYIRALNGRGIPVDLIIVGEGDRTLVYQELANRSIILPGLHSNLGGNFFSKLKEIYKIWRYGRMNKGKVTSSLTGPYSAIIYRRPIFIFLAGMVGKILGAKVFWHMPNIVSNKFSRAFYTYFLRHYRITPIANSEYTRQTLPNICRHVIYPGYSADRIRNVSENYREELNIDPDAPVFGMAGRVCADKAQDILIEAFLNTDAITQGAHLIFAGGFISDAYKEHLKSLSGRYLGRQIHFLGRIDNVNKFYGTIDVVLNGRRNAEPFGISIAEAQAAGLPVIAYYLGGPSEMIINGKTGWLVDFPGTASWTHAIDQAMVSREAWGSMGKAAIEHIRKFDVESNVKRLIGLIDS